MGLLKTKQKKVSDFRGCAVLIYSGDPIFLDYYRATFARMGLTPVTAATPEAARGILRLTVVSFVVVDQDENLFGCRQVLQHAREMQRKAPVVVVTRKPDQNFRSEALAMGAADYLGHPAPPDDILQVLLAGHNRGQTSAHRAAY